MTWLQVVLLMKFMIHNNIIHNICCVNKVRIYNTEGEKLNVQKVNVAP